MNNPYKIELGIGLRPQDFNNIKADIKSLEDKPIRLKIDTETKELTKSIQDALKALSKGGQNAFTIDTSKLDESIKDIKIAVLDLQKTFGSLGDNVNMKNLLSSVNQIANAIGKVTDESETLSKSLSALSKKDFGFNFNLKTGNANPLKAATDYGQAASRKAIPAIKEQINYLKDVINVTMDADKALQRYLMKQHKGYAGMQLKNSLEKQVLSGYDLNGEKVSKSDRMVAGEELIGYYKEIAALNNISLDGFNSKFSKSATEIVDDTTKIQTGVKQTEEAVESAVNEMKQMFGGGIGAEQLSTQLKPIVDDLHSIQEAITALSKDTSLGGLTASFNRLSESIENLLANAEKVKGVLNSGFDTNAIGADINSIKSPKSTRRRTQSEADEYLNGYLKHWNIKGENAKTVKGKFEAFSQVSSRGVGDELYEAALDDLMNTLKQLGSVSKTADDDAKKLLATLKGYNIDAPKDKYKSEFGDDWKNIKNKYKILKSGNGIPVDAAYQELSGDSGFSSYFPDDIWNEYDQLRKIIEVYDELERRSKNRKVNISDEYTDTNLRNQVLDIVSVMQEQSEAEQKVAQASTQTTNVVTQNENQKQQKYEETKQKLDEVNRAVAEHKEVIEDPNKFASLGDNAFSYMDEYDDLIRQQKELESALKSGEQQAKQTANSYEKISRSTSLVGNDDSFQKTFEASNQAAQEAQKHFQELLADEKAVVSVTEQFDDNNALQSFVVNIKRATGEVETLRYAMDKLNDEGDEGFAYQGGSSSDSRVEKQLEARIKKANDLQIKLDKIKSGYDDMGAEKPIKDDDHINALDDQYEKVKRAILDVKNVDDSTFSSMVSNAQKEQAVLENMVREFRNAENVATSLRSKDIDTVKATYASDLDILIQKMKDADIYTSGFQRGAENLQTALSNATNKTDLVSFLNGLDKLDAGYKRAAQSAKSFASAEIYSKRAQGLAESIKNIQRISPEINEFEVEINGAKVSVQSLLEALSQVKTKGDFSSANEDLKVFKRAAEAAGIAIRETAQKAKSINDIKIKIGDTGFNGFEQEVLRARNAAEELEGVYPDLEAALKRLDVAMESVYSADQSGDIKRLVAANEEYENSLKQVYSQLKLYQQAEKNMYKAEMLQQKKSALSSEMEVWLKENTRAAKDFGEEIRRLQASLNGLDDKGVKLVGQQFKNVKRQAQAMGKTGLTVFDKLKSKVKEYASYLSAAELFMYAEQGLRSMFEQVKLIDSAMTELKKVTDETDASYNKFLSNAAKRSKELGTTIDGLVSSTADFARLGYGFEDAQGLAEVANIYAVVGDEIEGVEGATESLISTMAAFKDEMNGMSNTDFAMSIIDKFNEIGNNFAISSGGIGEALERSASSLMAANNTIDESIALITAANSVVQDPTQVGRLMPTKKVAISVKLQRWTRPRKDFISIFDIHQLGRVYIFFEQISIKEVILCQQKDN